MTKLLIRNDEAVNALENLQKKWKETPKTIKRTKWQKKMEKTGWRQTITRIVRVKSAFPINCQLTIRCDERTKENGSVAGENVNKNTVFTKTFSVDCWMVAWSVPSVVKWMTKPTKQTISSRKKWRDKRRILKKLSKYKKRRFAMNFGVYESRRNEQRRVGPFENAKVTHFYFNRKSQNMPWQRRRWPNWE